MLLSMTSMLRNCLEQWQCGALTSLWKDVRVKATLRNTAVSVSEMQCIS